MAKNGNSVGSVIVAFTLGALAGAALALLYAPASGEETRRRLAEKAKEGRDRAQSAAQEGREFLERQRDNVSSTLERGRQAFEQGRQAFDQARKETL
jgi:gas vesicle protein